MQAYGFRFYFTPVPRSFSPFPHGTFLYRSFRSILPWMVVHPASHRVPRVPWYSGYRPSRQPFAYGGLTLCARTSQSVLLNCFRFMPVLNPGGPKTSGLGSSLFARRYWGNLGGSLTISLTQLFVCFPSCFVIVSRHSHRYASFLCLAVQKTSYASAFSPMVSEPQLITFPPAT